MIYDGNLCLTMVFGDSPQNRDTPSLDGLLQGKSQENSVIWELLSLRKLSHEKNEKCGNMMQYDAMMRIKTCQDIGNHGLT